MTKNSTGKDKDMALITSAMMNLAAAMKRHADCGFFDDRNTQTIYFAKARQIHRNSGTSLLFTRDVGYHTSGWFKNPDYERCYHLSMTFFDLESNTYRPYEPELAEAWVRAFYGDWARYVWHEGPSSESPGEIHHYRVFCDPAWQPIIPRAEVYTRDFIEKGWKSFSDLQYEKRQSESEDHDS